MYMNQDAYSKTITSIYFVLAVVVCAFFLINLTIAVMLKNYDELDKSEQNTKHQANLIEIGMETKLPSRLIYFIIKEENLIISKKAKKLKTKDENESMKDRLFQNFIYSKIEVPEDGYHRYKFTRFFYWLVNLPIYGTVILFFILVNTIILSLERYPMPDDEENAYNKVNIVFTSVFTIEVVFKIIGLSPRAFLADKFNIFDSIIVIISVVELFFSSGSGGVSALRAFRLFRIFKLFRTGNLRVLLDSIAYTMSTIGNYVILLGLFIYVYALLGMQFFAGNLKFDEDGFYDPKNGSVPRAHFDTLYWAAITVFQILIGDNWNEVMFDCELAVGRISAIYFISLILFGNIVMLNLFLAILLGNFDKARSYWLKKRIFEMFDTAIKRGYTLSHALSLVLGEVTHTVNQELLVHEPRDIFKLNGRLSIINRKLMMNDPETEDQVLFYDKVAQYQLDYKPIEEVARDDASQYENSKSDNDSDKSDQNLNDNYNNEKSKSSLQKTQKLEEEKQSQSNNLGSMKITKNENLLEIQNPPKNQARRYRKIGSSKLEKSVTKKEGGMDFLNLSNNSNEEEKRPITNRSVNKAVSHPLDEDNKLSEIKKVKNPNKIRFTNLQSDPENNEMDANLAVLKKTHSGINLLDEEDEDKPIDKSPMLEEPDDEAEYINEVKITEPSPLNEEFDHDHDIEENLIKVKENRSLLSRI